MTTKVLSLFNLNRRGSGVNLNLFRYTAMVIMLLTLGITNAWGGNSDYYSQAGVAVKTGAGTVYVGTSTSYGTSTTGSSVTYAEKKKTNAGSAPTDTWYIKAVPDAGYAFTSWTTGGSWKAAPSTSTATTSGTITASTSTAQANAQANFTAVSVSSAPANIDLAPTDPSAIYPVETSERTLTFTTSTSNALTDFTNSPANGASGKFTFSNWRRVDATHVAVDYQFTGGGSYGGVSRTNSVTVSLKGVAHSTTKSCTITANFPNAKIADGSADEVFATYKSTDATQIGVAKTAVFDVEYVDGTNNFDTPAFTGAGASHFTYNSMSYADGKLTVNYTYNGNKENGTHTATLTLKVNDAIGGTDATYGSKAITITAHNEEEATDDVRVTNSGGGTVYQGDWATAIASHQAAGYTFTLLRNIDLGTITATNNITKAITIDLNGKELRAAVNKDKVGILNINAAVAVTIQDSKTGGKIINEHALNAQLRTITVTKGSLTLESGTLAVNNTGQYASAANADLGVAKYASCTARVIQQEAGTTVNINGGKVEAYGTRSVYGIVQASTAATNAAGTSVLNISGGEIYAEGPYNILGVYAYGKVNMSAGVINTHINTNMVDARYAADHANNQNNAQGYGIYMAVTSSATATSCYYGTLNMTGGTINVVSDRTKAADLRNYGIFLNGTVTGVGAGKTASDGTLSQKACAVAHLDGATVNVTSGTYYSYGVMANGSYNSTDNSHTVMQIKNSKFTVKAYLYTYGIYANANINSSTGGCYAADMELTADTVWAESVNTHTAYAVMCASAATTLYKNSTSVYYGEYAVGAKVTINSGKYTAKTKTTTAYAVVSSTRSKSTYDPETSVSTERKLGGAAEAYAEVIIHGGTFRGEATTTTSRAVSSGGYTTIDGGTFEAYSGTTTSYGLYAVSGKLTASGVSVSASGTTTAYGVVADAGITRNAPSGFAYSGEVELNNCTITATSRTGATCRGVFINGTSGIFTDATFISDSTSNKWSAANAIIYHAIYPTGASRAIAGKATINGGSITANAATTDAYGIYQVITPVATDGVAKDAGMLSVKNATIYAESKGGNTAHGIYAGGKANIEGCTITAKTSAANAYGVDAYDDEVKVKKSTITTTAGTSGSYGILASGAVHSAGVKRESVMTVDSCTVTTTAGTTTSYAVYATGTSGGAYATDYYTGSMAVAGTITVNGGKYTSSATTSTAYAAAVADPITKNEATATPSVIINEGKFKGTAGATPYADVSVNGEPGYFVLNGGYYVKDENLDKKLGEGMNKVAVKSGTPEYTEGYRWRITDNMTGEIVCKVYEGTTLKQSYQSLEEALAYVNLPDNSSKTQTIVMCGNYTLSSGDYELPANKTLLVPYKSSGTGKGATQAVGASPVWVNYDTKYITPTPLYKLTFASGVNLTVKNTAAIEASCVTYITNGASGQGASLLVNGTGIPHDKYGWLYLEEGSHIDLESGAALYAWGYVTGKGEINAKNGSVVYEDFQMGDWRGGTVELAIQGNKNGLNSKGVFPITHYYYQNIECPITYRAGSTAYALGGTAVNALGATNAVTDPAVQFIGTTGAMFLLDPATAGEDTWVRKEYDPETDYVNWTLSSGAKIGSVTLKMSALGLNINLNSSDYVLPITSNFNIIANYGDVEITNDVCFIPGSKLTIKKEANVIIPSGKNVFFYDQDDWKSYSGYWFCPGYSPSWKKNPRSVLGANTSIKMPDADVLVEGTLTLNGKTYTTAGGSNIHSTRENSGKVIFGAMAPASTSAVPAFTGKNGTTATLCQVISAPGSDPNFEGKALNSVWLKNEDGTYAGTIGTASGKTWIYMLDDEDGKYKWILSYDDGCFTYKNSGSGEHQLIHPSDWVAVEANANGDHAYHSEAGNRMFVNAEAASTSASCVWWEVNPTPEVIDAVTYYVANNDYFDNYGTYYYWDNSVSYWKPKKVTVTWNDKDGNKITNGTYGDEYNFNTSPVFHGTNPTWANTTTEKHDWIGWRDAEGNIYEKNATLPRATSNVIYTAYFNTTKYQYTITFKNDDNSDLWAGLVDAGTTGVQLQTLFETKYNEKTGSTIPLKAPSVDKVYTFDSWNTALQEVTGAATYTATYTWVTRKYHVTFYNYDAATVLYEADVDYNTRPVYDGVTPFRANTSVYSYEWTGWRQGANTYDTDDDLALVAGDVYYVATFAQTELRYQVFFKRQDGSIIDAPFFSFEDTPAAFPADPTLASTVSTDYTFDHWDPAELVPVTEDGKVYTAYFSESPRQYTAHFVNYDGTTLGVDQTIDYNTIPEYTGATPFKPNDSRNSFEFSGWAWSAGDGWEAGSIGIGEAFPVIKGDITFTAQYNPVLLQFDVIYQREDGTVILRDKKKWGENTAFPTSGLDYEDATYTYTFDHWSPATVVNPVTTNATYTAYYNQSIKTYSITAVGISPAGYGSVSPASLASIPGGSAVSVNGNKITVNGTTITATPTAATAQYTYAFEHWNNVPATVTANISDIEAVFTRTTNTYTVTWKNGDTTLETDEEVAYGTAPTFDGDEPTKTTDATYGYTFDGWDDGTSVYAVDALPTVSGAVTYTAHYSTAPTVASVTVSGETTYYATLQAAFDYAADKTAPTIKVLADIALTAKVTYTNTSKTTVTIDLNGHTVSGALNPLLTLTSASSTGGLIVIKSSVDGGQIRNIISSTKARYCVSLSKGKLKLESGTIYNENTNTGASYAVSSSRTFTMTGGQLEAKGKTGVYPLYSTGTSNISGGSIVATETTSGTTAGVFAIAGTTTISGEVDVQVTGTTNVYGARVGLRPNTSGAVYNGTLNITGGTFNVHASTSSAVGVYSYAGTRAIDYATSATNAKNYACAGTANISGGEFTVTSDGAKAYGVYVTGTVSIATAKDADGNATYAAASATSKANVTGGKFNVSGTSDVMAVNTSATNTDLVVEGGWYNINTNLDDYTAPTKTCNYVVLPNADATYLYKVAEAYQITFNNEDGTQLQQSYQEKNAMATYSGETPTKAEDDDYTYTFDGWSPALATVTDAATYTATYTSTPKMQYKYIDPSTGEEVTSSSEITPGDYEDEDYHYTFAGTWTDESATVKRANYNSSERFYGGYLDIVDWTTTHIIVNVNGVKAATGGANWSIIKGSNSYPRTNCETNRTLQIARGGVHTADDYVVLKLKGTGATESRQKYTVPHIFDADGTYSGKNEHSVIYVHSGTLTISESGVKAAAIYVSAGAELRVTGSLTVGTLVLRTTPYNAAVLTNEGTISATKVYYTRIQDYTQYYQFGLPLSCDVSDVTTSNYGKLGYSAATYGSAWILKAYSEASRATNGVSAGTSNWTLVASDGTVAGGYGYEMMSTYKYYREFYFPVDLSELSNEVNMSYTPNESNKDKHSGWNAVTSPRMGYQENNPAPEGITISVLLENGDYEQVNPTRIQPAVPFYYQAPSAGKLVFGDNTVSFEKNASTPAPRRSVAATEEPTRIQWIHLDVKNAKGVGDQTSIYSHPTRYEDSYKTGIDVAKQTFTATRALIYSSHAYGEMAFAGVADSLLESGVALTVYSPSAQELTISMRENDWLNRMAYVWLVDHETGARTDLLWDTYTFEATEGTARGRFTIEGVFRAPQITTDIENAEMMNDEMMKVRKVLINQKMYILRGDQMYDATGKKVSK